MTDRNPSEWLTLEIPSDSAIEVRQIEPPLPKLIPGVSYGPAIDSTR